MKGERPVSTEKSDDADSIASLNAAITQEDASATIQAPTN